MIYGCGIDVEELGRFTKLVAEFGNGNFLSSVYTAKERENYLESDTALCMALGFSCKEAFWKAFGKGRLNAEINLTDIELIFYDHPEQNRFEVILSERFREIIKEHLISPVYESGYLITDDYVIFEALVECKK